MLELICLAIALVSVAVLPGCIRRAVKAPAPRLTAAEADALIRSLSKERAP